MYVSRYNFPIFSHALNLCIFNCICVDIAQMPIFTYLCIPQYVCSISRPYPIVGIIPTCILTLLLVLYPLVYSPYYWYYTHLYSHPIIGIIPTCILTLLLVLYPLVYSPYYWYYTHLYINPVIGIIPTCILTLLLVLYPLVY